MGFFSQGLFLQGVEDGLEFLIRDERGIEGCFGSVERLVLEGHGIEKSYAEIMTVRGNLDEMRLFFSTGEASGDAYAAALAKRFRGEVVRAEGVVGARGRAMGIEVVADNRDWGSIGIFESLRVAPRVLRGYRTALAALAQGEPGVCIPIDYGYLNIKLARRAKEMGWKVLYFVPPGSWRKTKQGADLPEITHEIVTPFEWSAEMLNKMGGSAHWFGHPLRQMVAESGDADGVREGIAVLPGSRMHEIESNVPAIAAALQNWTGRVRVSRAPNVDSGALRDVWRKAGVAEIEIETELYPLLKSSEVAIVCSGTATLESALCDCPSVVVYRGNKIMELEYRIRKPKFDYISLPNILLGRGLLPELIQWDAEPGMIWNEVEDLLGVGAERQRTGFRELEEILGPADALDRSADLIRDLASR